jgi:preprotein translocase subunit SecE
LMKKVKLFFGDIKAEMRKVEWPTKNNIVNYTILVIFFVFVMTLIVMLFDMSFGTIFNKLSK